MRKRKSSFVAIELEYEALVVATPAHQLFHLLSAHFSDVISYSGNEGRHVVLKRVTQGKYRGWLPPESDCLMDF